MKLGENYVFVLIGQGDNIESLKILVEKNNLSKKVIFLGEIKNEELSFYLSAFDIYIQPSIGHEAFGITVIEALSCSLPVIVSDNGGMKDIVKDGYNGYKFEIGNEIDLVEKIKLVEKNITSLTTRQSVIDKYSWDKFANEILN